MSSFEVRRTRRKEIEARILAHMSIAEPGGLNRLRYAAMFQEMSDEQFDQWMAELRDNKRQLTLYAPNMKVSLQVDDLLKYAKALGLVLFERLRLWDPATRRYILTPQAYPVLLLPVRRLKQNLMDKLSVPDSDQAIDLRSGQVIKPDKGSSVSLVEMQTMNSKGLDRAIVELMTLRGGNVTGYAQLKALLEDTGMARLDEIDPSTRVRSAVVAQIYLQAMMLDNNLASGDAPPTVV